MSTLIFDIGGTRMRIAMSAGDTVSNVQKFPTPKDVNKAVAVIASYAEEFQGKCTAAYGGVAGLIVDGVVVSSPHLPSWNGSDFQKMLAHVLKMPVHIQNDAELAGLGEAVYGAGKGKKIVAYLGIGTGVGSSLIVNGVVAPHASGFEAGHQILDIDTGETFESLVSGSGLEKTHGIKASGLSREPYDHMTPVLVTGIYNVLLAWSPDILVLGGSLMNEDNGYRMQDISRLLETLPGVLSQLPPVVPAQLGDECGLYGALAASA